MKTVTPPVRKAGPKTYIFGIFAVQHDRERNTRNLRIVLPRLITAVGITFVLMYVLVVAVGYFWLRNVRKLEKITIVDVALFQWKQVRRNFAAQQFESAGTDWRGGKYQSAFLAFYSALRNDPDNLTGRLQAADFLTAASATPLAVNVLTEGLQRAPKNLPLIEKTFDLLTTSSRDKEALALLKGPLASEMGGPNASVLHTYELTATFNLEGVSSARRLLEKYDDVRHRTLSALIVARILWESKEKLAAIEALQAYVKERPSHYSGYALLAQYQEAAGMNTDARETAERACVNLPQEIGPRILRIGTFSPLSVAESRPWRSAIESYISELGARPKAIEFLAEVAGRKGWVELSRAIYEASLTRQADSRVLALYYADGLLRNSRLKEASEILADLDEQSSGAGPLYASLRLRQIEVAGALGDRERERDLAKRLAASLHESPDTVEAYRRRFAQSGLPEAAAEMTIALSSLNARSVSKK